MERLFFIVLRFLPIFRRDVYQYTIPLCRDLHTILRWCQCLDKSISGVEIPRCCQTPFSVNNLVVQSFNFPFPKPWMYVKVHFFCDVSLLAWQIACHRPTFSCVSIVRPCHITEDNWSEEIFIQISQTNIGIIICGHSVKIGIFLLPSIVTLHSYVYKYKRTRRLFAGCLESWKPLTCEIMLVMNSLLSTDRHADGVS